MLSRRTFLLSAAAVPAVFSSPPPDALASSGRWYVQGFDPAKCGTTGQIAQIAETEDVTRLLPKNAFLGSFQDQFGGKPTVEFYTSLDGKCFNKVNSSPLPTVSGGNVNGGSPSYTYFNGKWYVVVGNFDSFNRDFIVYKSDRLTGPWVPIECTMGPTAIAGNTAPGASVPARSLFAPEFFIDNGRLYILISILYGPPIRGRKYFRQYFTELLNEDCCNMQWSVPVITNFGVDNARSLIDWHVCKIGRKYWVATKDNVDDDIRVYCGPTLRGPFELVRDIRNSFQVEAPVWAKYYESVYINGVEFERVKYRIYVDAYNTNGGTPFYYEADNPRGPWSTEIAVQTDDTVRHGTVANVRDLQNPQAALGDIHCMTAFVR